MRAESGLSLLEALIALALLVWASAAALGIYEKLWDSFENGEDAAEQQQRVRLAFDKLVLDLQLSGFNHNPDGNAARPDEQLEATYDTALVLRADFDGQAETALAGGFFDTVSVGNDEIVAYVLAKPDGSSPDTLTFAADVEEAQRDGTVETVSIPNVALVHDDPPYTLYRVTFDTDPDATWGTGDFIVWQELAANVSSLTFRYLDPQGEALNDEFDLDTTDDDIGGDEDALFTRSSVRGIEVALVGLTAEVERDWVDPSDPDPATRSYRKFELEASVKRRNAGLSGLRDLPAS